MLILEIKAGTIAANTFSAGSGTMSPNFLVYTGADGITYALMCGDNI